MGAVTSPTKLRTDIPGLDLLLEGGLVAGHAYMVMGPPGAGKTVLSNQICFNHAKGGAKTLFVTLLAESHTRLLANLRGFSFFDEKAVGKDILYLSGYSSLEEGGLNGLLELVRTELKRQRCTLLVIDGVVGAEEMATTRADFKKFVHGVQELTTMVGCTAILLATAGDPMHRAEHTMVDGLIVLRERIFGARAQREITIRKFRGSSHLHGSHMFQLDRDGVTVYPRLESVVTEEEAANASLPNASGRAKHAPRSFGIKGLDKMLQGGFKPGTCTMVVGSPASGKTLLGLHFLAQGVKEGEKGFYFSFYDPPARAVQQADGVGLKLEPMVKSGDLEMVFRSPRESMLDELGWEMLRGIRERKVKRLFLDGFDGLRKVAARKVRVSRFMTALVNACQAEGVSLVYSVELKLLVGPPIEFPVSGVSTMAENILFTRMFEADGELRRMLAVIKARNCDHDLACREFKISPRGLSVGDVVRGYDQVMTGVPLRARKAR